MTATFEPETLREIQVLLEKEGDFLSSGKQYAAEIARDWYNLGFDEVAVRQWGLEARCFDPMAAAELIDARVTPKEAAVIDDSIGGYEETLGFKAANCDLIAKDILARRKNGKKVPEKGLVPKKPVEGIPCKFNPEIFKKEVLAKVPAAVLSRKYGIPRTTIRRRRDKILAGFQA